MNKYDVVIHMDEPRFWVALVATVVSGLALVRHFGKLEGDAKERALRQMGWAILAMQVGYQLYMIFSPSFTYSIHRSLPLHMCGINIWLVALNCFWKNRWVNLFTMYMGTVGGLHAILTPQLTVGDAMPVLVHYYINHGALLFVPIVMNRTYGLRPFKWGWVKVYGLVALSSTLMAGINWAINTAFPSEVVANYMYMTEAPKVDNPFVFNELPWPWYVLPLHAAAVLHLIVINVVYRLTLPVRRDGVTPCTREVPVEGRMPVWQ